MELKLADNLAEADVADEAQIETPKRPRLT